MNDLIDHGDWIELPTDTLNEVVERAAYGFRRADKVAAATSHVAQESRIKNYAACVKAVRSRAEDDWRHARGRLWAEVCIAVDLALAASGKVAAPVPRSMAEDYPRCGGTAEDVQIVIAFHAARVAGDQRTFNAFATDWRRSSGAADEARIRGTQEGAA